MSKVLIVFIGILVLSTAVLAQDGSRQLQISAQASRPTTDLLVNTNFGYGGAIKGMYGFGEAKQQLTLEGGYNYFPINHLSTGVKAHYSAIPLYAGYRLLVSRFTMEAQAGISINRLDGRNNIISVSETRTNFGWAIGLGYMLKQFEIAARYQVSDITHSTEELDYLGIRLGYNLSL